MISKKNNCQSSEFTLQNIIIDFVFVYCSAWFENSISNLMIYRFNDDTAAEKKILPQYDDPVTDEVNFWLNDSPLVIMNEFSYLQLHA